MSALFIMTTKIFKMNFDEILTNFDIELKGRNDINVINEYESKLSKNVEELSKNEKFFNLPLNHIFSIISKVDFNIIEESDKTIGIIQNIIKNIIKMHYKEKETILILQNINTTEFSYDEIFSLLELITNCPILVHFCNLINEQNKEVDFDISYEMEQKNKEINALKEELRTIKQDYKITRKFPQIVEKPKDFESDLFEACEKGKLDSVQWLIEKEGKDPTISSIRISLDSPPHKHRGRLCLTPLNIATEYNHIDVIEYLVSKGANKTKATHDGCPVHIAAEKGFIQIVQYFIEREDVNIEIAGGYLDWTPLQYACSKNQFNVVKYLISKGANIDTQDSYLWTPLHYATFSGYTDIIKYLVSKGANTTLKNRDGNSPLNLAKNDEIKNFLLNIQTQK